MSTSSINIVGTVATEPRMITTQAGITLCTFRLASGERRYDRAQQKWIDGETSWFSVTAFRSLAEHAGKSLRKGERVIVSGRLRVRQWEKEERSGTSVDVEADALGHDLRWGVSHFEKLVRGEGAQEGSVDAASNSSQASWASAPAENGPESGDGTEEPYEHETPPETDEAASEQLSDDGFLPMAA